MHDEGLLKEDPVPGVHWESQGASRLPPLSAPRLVTLPQTSH